MPREVETIARAIAALAPLAPGAVAWLRGILASHPDPVAQRVAQILPEDSASRRAQRDIEGR